MHIFMKHASEVQQNKQPSARSINKNIVLDLPESHTIHETPNKTIQDTVLTSESRENITSEAFSTRLHTYVLQFVSKLYTHYSLSRNIIQMLIDDITVILKDISSLLDAKLSFINGDDIATNITDFQNMLALLQKPFQKLDSEYLRFKYYEESGSLIKPVTFVVGEQCVGVDTNDGAILDVKKCTASFIPPSLTLQKFLELPNVYDKIVEYVESLNNKDIICNIVQSQLWKYILVEYPNKMVLPLCFYYDDFEINNPLGTHAGISKLGAVYFSIACLPPQYISQLDNIFLVQLHLATHHNKFGNASVFKLLLQDLKLLENEGTTITTKQGNKKMVMLQYLNYFYKI
ncbi:hypothetical protein QE152_g12518 [Popillia japonica]|uniref:Uncharacterized protein n=1 Tax=Popillia japonica TaxID=7064 RepID=A0AAW1LRW2_POPJA